MAALFECDPLSVQYPSANFPQLLPVNSTERRLVLGFDATTVETCAWVRKLHRTPSGTITAAVTYSMASATTGGVAFEVLVEAITPGDAVDTDAATSYDSANTGTDASVPGTAGYVEEVSITLSAVDSWAAGDMVRISLRRATGNGTDTATGDAYVHMLTISDAA